MGRILASGGMATVHRGVYRPTGMPVAIKVLNESCWDDEILVHRFQQEARIQNILGRQHPGIVTCFEPIEFDGRPAIVLEFVPGQSLAEILDDEETFEPHEAIDIAVQALHALAHAHHRGIIHRDIKSENLILTPQGRIKIADFGVARADESDPRSRVTESRDLVGTIMFMAPEQLTSPATVDHRADLYSLGITLYEMVTGELPFDGDEGYPLMKRIEKSPPDDPRVYEPDLPECLATIILRSINKDPDDRYATAGEMSVALRDCSRNLGYELPHPDSYSRRGAPRGTAQTELLVLPEPRSFGWIEDLSRKLVPGRILLRRAGLKIGRHPERCDVVIPDDKIALEHLLLLPLEGGDVLLIDLDTESGTTVDGNATIRHRLDDGDRFTLANEWSFVFRR